MTDAELRRLVHDSVARHLGGATAPAPPAIGSAHPHAGSPRSVANHPSHYLYLTVTNTTDACVIEPGVRCDHCGYCKSHGH